MVPSLNQYVNQDSHETLELLPRASTEELPDDYQDTPAFRPANKSVIRTRNENSSVSNICSLCSPPSLSSARFFFVILLIVTFLAALLFYTRALQPENDFTTKWWTDIEKYRSYRSKLLLKSVVKSAFTTSRVNFARLLKDRTSTFDIQGNDVLVFLHIQKTGGTTLEKYLAKHLDIENPCLCTPGVKRCSCYRKPGSESNWLFSRYSTGWSCGLHADWTEMVESDCVDNTLDRLDGTAVKRRYFYMTILREPISRTVSEFRHVQRGATWKGARFMCHGRPPTAEEWPLCYDPDIGWANTTLTEFASCPFNPARNRMTRMLADLTLVGCYDITFMPQQKRDQIMLQSAKHNLEHEFAFYGLTEKMNETQFGFEFIFGLNFKRNFPTQHVSKSADTPITKEEMQLLVKMNNLDIELYKFATNLFNTRLNEMRNAKLKSVTGTNIYE